MITAFSALLFLAAPRGPAFAAAAGAGVFGGRTATIGEAFDGEVFDYTIGFWILDDVAEGSIGLRREADGTYVAELKARSTGVADTLVRHRRDSYVARLEEVEGGRRFRTVRFEKTVAWGWSRSRTVTELDYEKGVITWRTWKGGRLVDSASFPMEKGAYYDGPLTAFYNFRYGVYGPVGEGVSYAIRTFPKNSEKDSVILMTIAGRTEIRRRRDGKPAADYLADVKIDKEIFGSKSGEIEILFSKDMVPVEAVAKDIVLFGDVRGRLRGMTVPMTFSKSAGLRGGRKALK